MKITKTWAMPNKHTFDIKPIKELLDRWMSDTLHNSETHITVDPFANKNKLCYYTNDLDPQYNTMYNMDALDFLKTFEDSSVDFLLFDPPYSPRQVSECYRDLGKTVNMQTTQSSFWGNLKKEIGRIIKSEGVVITFGWNSGGIGKKYGFTQEEILLVAHGGWHNDTIVTVEMKK